MPRLSLFISVIETLEVQREHLALRAEKSFISVTELADTLVRERGLAFRQAHHVVSALVTDLMRSGRFDEPVSAAMLENVAASILGKPLELSQDELDQALNPRSFIEKRRHLGGAAPQATTNVLRKQSDILRMDQDWLYAERERLNDAAQRLRSNADEV